MGLAGSHRPRAPTRPATRWFPDRFHIHPVNALSIAPFPRRLGPWGSSGVVGGIPGLLRHGLGVMHGGYIGGAFSQSDGESPECCHNVDVSEAC
jgi:hypothetical protein